MTTRDLLVGLDAGTSVIKAVAYDREGRQVAATGTRNIYARREGGLAVEQDLNTTWRDAAQVLSRLAEIVPDLASRAAGLAVTGQGDGTCLVDRAGEPVAPAWLWLDARSAAIVEDFERSGRRQAIFRTTGCGLNGSNQSSHLLWLDRHRPHLLDRADFACHIKDWLYFRLTGERCTDVSEATFTFGDFRRRAYDEDVIAAFGLKHRRGLLPPIVDALRGEHHALTPKAAQATGLPEGLPVVLGYVDVLCTALAAGLYDRSARAGVSIVGSTGMHMRFEPDAASIELGPEASGYVMVLTPGAAARMQSNMAATINIDWLLTLTRQAAELLGHEFEAGRALAAFEEAVAGEKPGQALFHPYIDLAGERGPFVDPHARAQLVGLSNTVGFAGIVRSVYEGLAFAARDCFDAMGGPSQELRLAGGASRSPVLKSIFSSVLDVPVRDANREEAGAAGAAMLAALALGIEPTIESCCRTFVDPTLGRVIEPDPALVPLYHKLFPIYRELRTTMRCTWRELARVRAAVTEEAEGP
jgi:erythritol kinase (D-erythritol 1-phosphate-forming)